MVGTPVLRIVVSSDSMKKATAISQGSRLLLESGSGICAAGCAEVCAGPGVLAEAFGGMLGLTFSLLAEVTY